MPPAIYSRAELDAIKRETDLVAVLREQGIALKRRGRTYFGLCPFHREQTASFAVSRDAGLFHCFGCGAGGDVIRFVERTQQVSFSGSGAAPGAADRPDARRGRPVKSTVLRRHPRRCSSASSSTIIGPSARRVWRRRIWRGAG